MESLTKAFYHLKMAEIYFGDIVRDTKNRGSIAEKVSRDYVKRLQFIERDFRTNPLLPSEALNDFRNELNGDIMFHEAISQKALQLNPLQKEALETAIDCILKGESISIEVQNPNQ